MATLSHTLLLLAALQAGPPARVEVEPARAELELDATVQLELRVYDGAGNLVQGLPMRWLSVDPEVLSVDADGTVTALRPGTARVAAVVAGTAVGFSRVTVLDLPPASLDLSLPGDAILAGTGAPLLVRARTRLGETVEPTRIRFETLDPAVATVDADGRVFGLKPGRTRVRATLDAATGEIDVRVIESSGTLTLVPGNVTVRTGDVVRFAVRSSEAADAPPVWPAWAVSGSGAHIENEVGEGVFVAEEPGRYRVTAEVGRNDVRSAMVEVTPRQSDARLSLVGRGPTATHNSGDMWVFEGADGRDYAYVGTFMHDWMKAWDVTDPSQPLLTDSVQLDARRINDVKIHPNGRLGVLTREGASDRRNGIVILDLADPAHPTVLSEYTETVTGGVHNVWIRGEQNLVYACHNGTSDLHIIDISRPESPREVGRWGLDKAAKTLHDVIVQDGYAYLSYWDDGIVMLDVGAGTHGGTPTEPALVSRYAYPIGHTHVAWRHGRYLFVGDEIFPDRWSADRPIEARGYIHVIDYDDPENPREVARYEVPEAGAHNVWVEDDKLYVGYYQAGVRVVDVSGELRGDLYRQGRELAVLKTTDARSVVPNWPMAWGAQVYKGNVYSSDLNSGLWITRLETRPTVVF